MLKQVGKRMAQDRDEYNLDMMDTSRKSEIFPQERSYLGDQYDISTPWKLTAIEWAGLPPEQLKWPRQITA